VYVPGAFQAAGASVRKLESFVGTANQHIHASSSLHLRHVQLVAVHKVLLQLEGDLDRFDVGDLGDGQHAADEEAGEDVVVVHVVAQPHLDLRVWFGWVGGCVLDLGGCMAPECCMLWACRAPVRAVLHAA